MYRIFVIFLALTFGLQRAARRRQPNNPLL